MSEVRRVWFWNVSRADVALATHLSFRPRTWITAPHDWLRPIVIDPRDQAEIRAGLDYLVFTGRLPARSDGESQL